MPSTTGRRLNCNWKIWVRQCRINFLVSQVVSYNCMPLKSSCVVNLDFFLVVCLGFEGFVSVCLFVWFGLFVFLQTCSFVKSGYYSSWYILHTSIVNFCLFKSDSWELYLTRLCLNDCTTHSCPAETDNTCSFSSCPYLNYILICYRTSWVFFNVL